MNKRSEIIVTLVSVLVFAAMCALLPLEGWGEGAAIKIKVQPKTIGMLKGVVKLPITRVSIRSTELREAIKEYDPEKAATIERVHIEKKIGNRAPQKIEVADTFVIRFPGQDKYDIELLADECGDIAAVVSAERY